MTENKDFSSGVGLERLERLEIGVANAGAGGVFPLLPELLDLGSRYYTRCGCGCGFCWVPNTTRSECPQCKAIWHRCACGRAFGAPASEALDTVGTALTDTCLDCVARARQTSESRSEM
jgi:hypothetical protein